MTLCRTTRRRLLLLRHAKSAWPEDVPDFDRPLAPRGRKAAKRIGAYLTDKQLVPDLALISPARRARETWDRVRPHLGRIGERSEARLYEAAAGGLLAIVRETEPEVGALLIAVTLITLAVPLVTIAGVRLLKLRTA